jgi:hypothetical protein
MNNLQRGIRSLASNYIAGQLAFEEFNEGLALLTWDIAANDPAAALTYQIELLLAEYTSNHRPLESLRAGLSELLGGKLEIEARPPEPLFFSIQSARSDKIEWQTPTGAHRAMPVRGLASNETRRELVLA